MKDTLLELELGNPVHQGACIARAKDGRVFFVLGGLPGETVTARVIHVQKSLAWAKVVEVLTASPDRQPHIWAEGQAKDVAIGAINLGHVKPAAQRAWKSTVLMDQLGRIGGQQVLEQVLALTGGQPVPVHSAPGDEDPLDPLLGRRTRITLTADKNSQLGMQKYRSHQVQPLETMPLADPKMLLDVLGEAGGKKWQGTWQPGSRVDLVAPNASRPVIAVHKTHTLAGKGRYSTARNRRAFAQRKRATKPTEVVEVYAAPGWRTQTNQVTWQVSAGGKNRSFLVSATGFWQTHRAAPRLLVERVLAAVKTAPGETGLELYSGAGLFTGFLCDALGPTGQLATLEGAKQAIKDAGRNLRTEIKSGQLQLFHGKVDHQTVSELAAVNGGRPDFVVLDPPRKGAGIDTIRGIDATGAERVVLVSCDPTAAARDLKDLTSRSYVLSSIEAWDLFPHTHHFEVISLLHRKS